MTDLHSHLLPGIDDGAKTLADAVAMLKMQQADGVRTVCVTPHFYPGRETPDEFLARRAAALEQLLPAAAPYGIPELIGVALAVLLHVWKRNTLLSIGVSTVAYMVLVQVVF